MGSLASLVAKLAAEEKRTCTPDGCASGGPQCLERPDVAGPYVCSSEQALVAKSYVHACTWKYVVYNFQLAFTRVAQARQRIGLS